MNTLDKYVKQETQTLAHKLQQSYANRETIEKYEQAALMLGLTVIISPSAYSDNFVIWLSGDLSNIADKVEREETIGGWPTWAIGGFAAVHVGV